MTGVGMFSSRFCSASSRRRPKASSAFTWEELASSPPLVISIGSRLRPDPYTCGRSRLPARVALSGPPSGLPVIRTGRAFEFYRLITTLSSANPI
jgi:hypothetical protein